jgi:outer membrane protein OmpA-like peptidoglycan-associated protein
MRYSSILLALMAAGAVAEAQTYPGQDVTVNLPGQPVTMGSGVLLYPGGQYGRVVKPLREPGDNDAPILLHMPKHKHADRHVVPTTAAAIDSNPLPQASAPRKRHVAVAPPVLPPVPPAAPAVVPKRQTLVGLPPPPKRQAAAMPPVPPPPVRKTPTLRQDAQVARSTPALPMQGFGDLMVSRPKAAAAPVARTAPPPAPHVASIEPPRTPPATRKVSGDTVGARRGSIGFEANASDPTGAALQSVSKIADSLNASLGGGAARVQLLAYAGPRGGKSSDARRLSLKRALIVRQLLIDAGVPSERIDVRAMGGADDGAAERVDVLLK